LIKILTHGSLRDPEDAGDPALRLAYGAGVGGECSIWNIRAVKPRGIALVVAGACSIWNKLAIHGCHSDPEDAGDAMLHRGEIGRMRPWRAAKWHPIRLSACNRW
jgi:hypothetical protein